MATSRALARASAAGVAFGAILRDRRHDRLVERLGLGAEILIPAHQFGEAVVAGGDPHRELVHGGCGGGLRAALDRIERIVQRLFGRQQLLALRVEQHRQRDAQLGAPAADQPLHQRQGIGRASFGAIEEGEIVGRYRRIRMIDADRALADRQRAPIQRLGIGEPAAPLVEIGQIVQRARDVGMIGPSTFSRIASERLISGSASA